MWLLAWGLRFTAYGFRGLIALLGILCVYQLVMITITEGLALREIVVMIALPVLIAGAILPEVWADWIDRRNRK